MNVDWENVDERDKAIPIMVEWLRQAGWTVEPPEQEAAVTVAPPEQEPAADVPFVAIGAGQQAPWSHLPLTCPTCGAGPLPLEDSQGSDKTGIKLQFISHCGGTWLRGQLGGSD